VTPTPLLLAGTGGLARETLELVRAINGMAPAWRPVGFLDDDPGRHGMDIAGISVIGPCAAAAEWPEAMVVACVASPADPSRRLRLIDRLGLAPSRYATLIHPAAVIPASATLGPGCIVHAATVLTADIRLGAHVAVMPAVVLTHDDVIADGVTFGAGARVAGGVTVGAGAYIGSGALLRESIEIGPGAVIGMGAVVTRSVGAGETWAGVPARPLRTSSDLHPVARTNVGRAAVV
jgi:sugar O-acyltransferase (sialic acid O-acetyltransferase NeuD family)